MARVMEVPLTERQGEIEGHVPSSRENFENIADRCKLISES